MIVLDIETSGLFPEKHGIWQIAALDLSNPSNYFFEEASLDMDDEISVQALKVIGKTSEELRDKNKQSQKELLERLFNWISSVKMKNCLCQNPQFDLTFIAQKARKYDLKSPIHHRAFDLHTLANHIYFNLNGSFLLKDDHSGMALPQVLELCGIKDPRRSISLGGKTEKDGLPHDALGDVKLTAEAFSRLLYGKNIFPEFLSFSIPDYLKK